jgi:hypothetical protein
MKPGAFAQVAGSPNGTLAAFAAILSVDICYPRAPLMRWLAISSSPSMQLA